MGVFYGPLLAFAITIRKLLWECHYIVEQIRRSLRLIWCKVLSIVASLAYVSEVCEYYFYLFEVSPLEVISVIESGLESMKINLFNRWSVKRVIDIFWLTIPKKTSGHRNEKSTFDELLLLPCFRIYHALSYKDFFTLDISSPNITIKNILK